MGFNSGFKGLKTNGRKKSYRRKKVNHRHELTNWTHNHSFSAVTYWSPSSILGTNRNYIFVIARNVVRIRTGYQDVYPSYQRATKTFRLLCTGLKYLRFVGCRVVICLPSSRMFHRMVSYKFITNRSQWPTWRINFLNIFFTILYMFQAISCSSSGGKIVLIQHLVSSLSVSDDTRCCINFLAPEFYI